MDQNTFQGSFKINLKEVAMNSEIKFTLCSLDGEDIVSLKEKIALQDLGEDLPRIAEDLLEDCTNEDFDEAPIAVQNLYNSLANGSPIYFRDFSVENEGDDICICCEVTSKELYGNVEEGLGLVVEISTLNIANSLINQACNSLAINGHMEL